MPGREDVLGLAYLALPPSMCQPWGGTLRNRNAVKTSMDKV